MQHFHKSTPNSTPQTPLAQASAAALLAGLALVIAPFAPAYTAPASVAVGTGAAASVPQASKMDRLFAKNAKTGKIQANGGAITEALMSGFKVTGRNGKSKSFDAVEVVQVAWGEVPDSFNDGVTYANRGEWENAVTNFQSAAGDSDARDAVRAAARVRSIESMMAWGAADPAHFTDAIAEADRYLSDHGTDWQMARVRFLKARATWLSGDATGARDGFKSLFEAGKAGGDGFAPLAVAGAALAGAQAALNSTETSTARELFDSAASAFAAIDSSDAAVMAQAKAGAEVAGLASAQSYLAKEDWDSAAREFESAIGSLKTSAGIGAAKLGLGLAQVGQGKMVEAQLNLGWVAGLDHTSHDRQADALVGLAQAAMASEGGAVLAKASLQRVKADFGATPAAAKAAELLAGL